MVEILILGIFILICSEFRNYKQLETLKQLALLNKSPDVFSYKEVTEGTPEEEEKKEIHFQSMQDVSPEDLKGATIRYAQELPQTDE